MMTLEESPTTLTNENLSESDTKLGSDIAGEINASELIKGHVKGALTQVLQSINEPSTLLALTIGGDDLFRNILRALNITFTSGVVCGIKMEKQELPSNFGDIFGISKEPKESENQ